MRQLTQDTENKRTLTLGYSLCPNDTFIFYALVHKKIDSGGLGFKETLLDVDTLNNMALKAELDVTKVSFHAYGYLRNKYSLLSSGSALGRGCGPLLISKAGRTLKSLKGKRIAIPGNLTTAYLLLRLYDPSLAEDVVIMPFYRIPDAVSRGEAEAGLIIHESRFTYPEYGLSEMLDLGKWWEAETGLPIPLGCVIAKKELGRDIIEAVNVLVRKSAEYALASREETRGYIKAHSRELEDSVIDRHINLYVNDYSIDLGEDGMRAVEELFKKAEEKGIIRETKNAAVW